MKKLIIVFVCIFALLIGAMAVVPIIFKDDIKAAIDKEIAKSVDADVYFNPEKFGISLFSHFPNATIGLEEFGIVGRHEFEGEVLLAVQKFELEVNLMNLIFGDEIKIDGINLNEPQIFIKVLEDGKANYDIFNSDSSAIEETSEESGDVAIQIEEWNIINGEFVYDDQSIPYHMSLHGLNHSGGGNLNASVFDMKSKTEVESALINFDGVNYLSNKRLDLDMVMNMDLDQMKFTFKDNALKVNDFLINAEGFFAMPEEGFDMDLKFSSPASDFKSILSLVPGIYTEGFESINTSGELAFACDVKGMYTEEKMPSFHLDLKVINAMFKYPDLPNAVENINIDLSLANEDGDPQHTSIDLRQFDLEFDGNPLHAVAKMDGVSPANISADVKAKLDLAKLNKAFPMEGLEMSGLYTLNLEAEGVYDSIKSRFPNVNAAMSLSDGFFKYDDYPIPIEKVNLTSTVENKGGSMKETVINLQNFHMLVDGKEVSGKLFLQDLENYHWDAHLDGSIDLEKIGKIMHLDSMELKGIIAAKIDSKGTYAFVEAEQYEKIETSGTMNIKDFLFRSADLPMGFSISNASAGFNPKSISLTEFNGSLGQSDMQVTGRISDYLEYIMSDHAVLSGNFDYYVNKFDANEWMVEEGEVSEDTTSYETELIPIPKNLDFKLKATVKEVLYDNMTLRDINGNVIIRDGKAILENVAFNSLGGSFVMNGTYNTTDTNDPKFSFDLDMKNVSIRESFNTFNTIKTFAPIAQFLDGSFSTDFTISGDLGQDMMPKPGSISGKGLVNVVKAVLQDNKFTNGISNLTSLDVNKSKVFIENMLLETEIKDGKLNVKPFDIKLGGFQTKVSGSTGMDGSLNYDLAMDVPAGSYGQKFNNLVSSLGGQQSQSSDHITLPIKLTESFTDPKFTLGQLVSKDQVKGQVKGLVKQEALKQLNDNKSSLVKDENVANALDNASVEESKAELQAKKDSIKKAMEVQAQARQDSIKKAAEAAKKEASKKIKGLLKFKKD